MALACAAALAAGGCVRIEEGGSAVISGSVVIGESRELPDGRGLGPGVGAGVLYQPRGIEVLDDGSCLVVDRTGRIQHFLANGEVAATWILPEWSAGQPTDLVSTAHQTVLIADTHYGRVLEYDFDGMEVRRFVAGPGDETLDLVRGIAVTDGGEIFVARYGDEDRIHKFSRDGRLLDSFGQRGDGPGDFLRPEGIAIGEDGDLFIVDCGHHRVLRYTQDGEFLSSFGGEGEGPGQFLFPFDIAVGSDDTLYVVDFQGNRVQRFSSDGELLGTAGSAGRETGRFRTPRGVAVLPDDSGDIVFVADTNNHRVQKFRWKYDR